MTRPLLILLALSFAAGTDRADSLPRFALGAGARCASCHVGPGGGGMRNRYGLTFGAANLSMASHGPGEGDGQAAPFDPRIGESIAVGGDIRTQFLRESFGGTTGFHMMTASVYLDAALSGDISAHARFDLVNPAYGERSGPEIWVLARVLPGRWYVRAGSFHPTYGIRIDDHTGYTRGGDLGSLPGTVALPGLIFVPNYKDVGLEAGGHAGGLEVAAGVFNGTGNAARLDFRDAKAFVARVEYRAAAGGVNLLLGASGYLFGAYRMGGVHAGAGWDGVAVYGEVDLTRNRISPSGFVLDRRSDAAAAFGAAEIRVSRGVWITGRHDVFDPARGTPAPPFRRTTVGLELFPWPFIELRPQYRFTAETPPVDNNTALLQLHAWF